LKNIYHKILEIENGNQKAVLCTVISTKGSTPRKRGTKMLVFDTEKIFGSIGGGALEKKVISEAQEVIKSGLSKIVSHNLVKDLDMCCGGMVELFLEPIMNKKKLYIFGAGHIGKSLSQFANDLNFNVFLIDDRINAFEDMQSNEIQFVPNNYHEAIEKLNFDENTFIVIVTHDHAYDREILALTSKQKNGYIGMVGSQRKVQIAKNMLSTNNLMSKNDLEAVDMPIGLNIKAITPEEIAVSILAKLIEVRNK
jgi:xanthine dehydrogenase accessory factor